MNHKNISSVDNTQHNIVSCNDYEDLQNYIQDMPIMLIQYCKYYSLKINGNSTKLIVMNTNTEANNLFIVDNENNIICVAKTMKILSIIINRENNMYEHLSAMMNRIQITYNKIRGALRFMNVKRRKIIVESKINSQICK